MSARNTRGHNKPMAPRRVSPDKSANRKSPIKGNVKRKVLPFGSMPIFFSRHSAQLIGRVLRFLSPVVPISLS